MKYKWKDIYGFSKLVGLKKPKNKKSKIKNGIHTNNKS